MIEPINKVKLSELVYEQLLQNIFSGEWPEGTRLPGENELARKFNVSRVPIREAIMKLQVMGIVATEQGRGTYVVHADASNLIGMIEPFFSCNPKNIHDILDYRRMIEPDCVMRIAKQQREADLERIGKYAVPITQFSNPKDEFPEYDLSFHSQIVIASGNQFLIAINKITQNVMRKYHEISSTPKTMRQAAQDHVLLYEAMRDGKALEAAELMRNHIDLFINSL